MRNRFNKTLMNDFHYNYMKKKYSHKGKLLFTDTDFITIKIETNDMYENVQKDKNSLILLSIKKFKVL